MQQALHVALGANGTRDTLQQSTYVVQSLCPGQPRLRPKSRKLLGIGSKASEVLLHSRRGPDKAAVAESGVACNSSVVAGWDVA